MAEKMENFGNLDDSDESFFSEQEIKEMKGRVKQRTSKEKKTMEGQIEESIILHEVRQEAKEADESLVLLKARKKVIEDLIAEEKLKKRLLKKDKKELEEFSEKIEGEKKFAKRAMVNELRVYKDSDKIKRLSEELKEVKKKIKEKSKDIDS